MAVSNLNKFNAFNGFSANIAEYGMTAEEFKLQQGTPDGNPVVSPMPKPAVSEARLALGSAGSDKLRLRGPLKPAANAYAGPGRNLTHTRNAVQKLSSQVITSLREHIFQDACANPEARKGPRGSMHRVGVLIEFLNHKNALAEEVDAKTQANSKG